MYATAKPTFLWSLFQLSPIRKLVDLGRQTSSGRWAFNNDSLMFNQLVYNASLPDHHASTAVQPQIVPGTPCSSPSVKTGFTIKLPASDLAAIGFFSRLRTRRNSTCKFSTGSAGSQCQKLVDNNYKESGAELSRYQMYETYPPTHTPFRVNPFACRCQSSGVVFCGALWQLLCLMWHGPHEGTQRWALRTP